MCHLVSLKRQYLQIARNEFYDNVCIIKYFDILEKIKILTI